MLNLKKILFGVTVVGVLVAGVQAVERLAAREVFDPMLSPATPSKLAARSLLVAAANAGTRLITVGERGHILFSDDQGQSWRQAEVPVSVTLTAVQFLDEKVGWAVGHSGIILKTTDGGEHWSKQLDGQQILKQLSEVRVSDDQVLQRIERQKKDGPDRPFLSVHFSDLNNGLAVGAYGLVFSTSDGGAHWEPKLDFIPNPEERHLYVIHERPDAMYVAGEQGRLWRHAVGQQKFEMLKTPFQNTVFDLLSSGPGGALIALGLGGKVYRSADQGRTWQNIDLPSKASLTAGLNMRGFLILAGEDGQLFISNDAGKTFQIGPKYAFPIAGLTLTSENKILVVGYSGSQILTLSTLQATN